MSDLCVLHVAQPMDGGVPRVVRDLAASQVLRGWDVVVACPVASELRELAVAAGARCVAWEARRSPGPWVAREAAALRRSLEALSPDLVHLHSAKAGLAGRLALRGRVPTVFQPHSWSFEAVRGASRRAAIAWEVAGARWADAVACVSEDERERGRSVGIRARWAILPNGVDVDALGLVSGEERAAARSRLSLRAGPLALLVGRVSEQKNQAAMAYSWPRVRERVPDAELVLVGDGPGREALHGEGVKAIGNRHDVADWLAAADVLVVPSLWEAGLSLVAMEAMARGRPVVAYDVAGMREGIDGAGAVVPRGDEAALIEELVARLADPARAAREGLEARRRITAHHDLRRTTAATAALYTTILDSRRHPHG